VYEASVAAVVVVSSKAPSSLPFFFYFLSLPDCAFFSLPDSTVWVDRERKRWVNGRAPWAGKREWGVFCKTVEIRSGLAGVCL
jgi:hypothetical protein